MTRTLIVVAAFLTLSVPAALAVPPEGKGKPDNPGNSAAAPGQQATKNAAKKCKDMRKNNLAAFQSTYGTRPNAFGKCVSAQVKKAEEAAEAQETKENAAKACKREREESGLDDFRKKYAPLNHPNGANAFGKCVSAMVKKTTTS